MNIKVSFIAAVVLAFVLSGIAQGAKYKLEEIPGLGSNGSGQWNVFDINNRGEVVGTSYTDYGWNGFIYHDGISHELSVLTTEAYDINDKGQMVGITQIDSDTMHPFFFDGVNAIDLQTKLEQAGIYHYGGSYATAWGCTNNGLVVGGYMNQSGYGRGYIYNHNNGTIADIGDLGGDGTSITGINKKGQIIGKSNPIEGSPALWHAFIYQNGVMQDIGGLADPVTYLSVDLSGINNKEQVVGTSDVDGGSHHAFIYENGTFQDINPVGADSSNAYKINENGQAMGFFNRSGEGQKSFLYSAGNIIEIGEMDTPYSMNDRGQIFGFTYIDDSWAEGIYSAGQVKTLGELIGDPDFVIYLTMHGGSGSNNTNFNRYINNSGQIIAGFGGFGDPLYIFTPGPWASSGGGSWGDGSKWDVSDIPSEAGDTATFGNSIGISSATINLDVDRTLSCVSINNTLGGTYTIAPGSPSGKLILDNTDNSAAMLIVLAGNHSITAPVQLKTYVTVEVNAFTDPNASLNISGQISEQDSAKSLIKRGDGKLILEGDNTYTGPTRIEEGILELASTGQISVDSEIITEQDGIFRVNGGIHAVGNINGTGSTEVIAGQLTINSFVQNTLTIGIGAKVILAPIPGGPLALSDHFSSVPEPSMIVISIIAGVCLMCLRKGKIKI